MISDEQQIEEVELLEKYLAGDNRAFGPLYYRYRGLFLYYVNKQLPKLPQDEKEDLAIDFLTIISGKLHMYDKDKSYFRTWMTSCILNHLSEYRNKKSTRNRKITHSINASSSNGDTYEIPIASDDDPLKSISYLNIIKLIKERLKEDDWKIFELHFLQGYNQQETGAKLGLREDTMWSRIKRIRKKLDGIQDL